MQGLIPQTFINELLNRTDIIEFIDSYVPLKKRGNSYIACCPFHHEKNPSFNVVTKQQFYHCFGCGASGNVISFAMNYLHQSFPDAIETLATRAGVQVPRDKYSDKSDQTRDLYQLLQRVANYYQHTLKTSGQIAITYLKQRGVNGDIALRFQIGYAPPGWQTLEVEFKAHKDSLIKTGMLIQKEEGKTYDRYRQRIMFPIHDRHGRIIGFGGRSLDKTQQPKYLNSPETPLFQKNRELYGLHQILQQQQAIPSILVVEGYMDVIALAQHGILNAVATLGTATSIYHIQLLSKHTKQLIFCFDGDAAGRQAAWRALESSLPYLSAGLDANFIFLPDGQDPDSLVRQEGSAQFLERLHNATPLNRFFFDTLGRDIDHSTVGGKSQLIHAAKPYLLKITEGPYKQLLITELARMTRIDEHRLNQLLTENAPAPDIHVKQTNITRSPIRLATALLLQHPSLYTTCLLHIKPEMLDPEQHQVLQMLIQQIAQNPMINTAAIVELWRDSSWFDSLNKLAAWEHQVPEAELAKEFVDIMLFLAKQNREKEILQLIAKARQHDLSAADRDKLQLLLKQRHEH